MSWSSEITEILELNNRGVDCLDNDDLPQALHYFQASLKKAREAKAFLVEQVPLPRPGKRPRGSEEDEEENVDDHQENPHFINDSRHHPMDPSQTSSPCCLELCVANSNTPENASAFAATSSNPSEPKAVLQTCGIKICIKQKEEECLKTSLKSSTLCSAIIIFNLGLVFHKRGLNGITPFLGGSQHQRFSEPIRMQTLLKACFLYEKSYRLLLSFDPNS